MTGPAASVAAGAAATRFATVAALDQQLVAQAKAEWYRMQLGNLQGSFVGQFLPAIQPGLVSAQTVAAQLGAASMAEQTAAAVAVNPAGFAGAASDGGPLTSLLAQPLIGLYVDLDNGMPAEDALQRGMDSMDRILVTQVQDAARAAEQVQMTTSHEVAYFVRITEPGACGRCLILSGKKYRYSTAFLRHPACRCSMGPCTVVDESRIKSPQELYDLLSVRERQEAFGVANARAIADGADINKVVNATGSKAGMGTTLRDPYGNTIKGTLIGAPKGGFRLVPEGIYRLAGDDRDEAVRLLTLHGYLNS